MTIEQWVKGLEYTLLQGSLDTKVNDLVYDSRNSFLMPQPLLFL